MKLMKTAVTTMAVSILSTGLLAQNTDPLIVEPQHVPTLENFKPLPPVDPEFSAELKAIVEKVGLDVMTPAAENPDEEDEWSSICLVDLSDIDNPRVAGWKEDNFIYPASTYKMYVLGEAIRQYQAGLISLDDERFVKSHNIRTGTKLADGQTVTVSEILRLMMQYSDNTAANEAIDLVDRRNASGLMRALGCDGSEVTRKYISRSSEDEGYANIVSTTTNAHHAATYLWAVETGAIGGGQGRALIKSYLAMNVTSGKRFRAGLPDSASLYSKTGWWNIFTSEAGIIEDGETKYILCVFTAKTAEEAEPLMAELVKEVHAMMTAED